MPKLYHGSPTSSVATLNPCESHIGSASQVFATPDIICAIAYSLKPNSTKESIKAHQAGVELPHAQLYDLKIYTNENRAPMMVFCHSDVEGRFKAHPEGNVYLLDDANFKPMKPNEETCEYVSACEAKVLSSLKLSVEDAMKYGVQIFLCSEPQLFLEKQEKAQIALRQSKESPSEFWNNFYKTEVEQGVLIHHNAVTNINPIDLATNKLPDESYIKNPDLIEQKLTPIPSQSVKDLVKIFQLQEASPLARGGKF